MLEELKHKVLEANLALVKYNLVTLTWGNVSGIDREENLVVIKPSGVDYDMMTADDMVVVDLNNNIIEGHRRPSSDTLTHIELYKAFNTIGGVSHTHSEYATIFAQAKMEIPCFGTTHADSFNGPVPLARFLYADEVHTDYELNTGKVIVERFENLDPAAIPGVLVSGHAPFSWGRSPIDAVKNSLILEKIAKMALINLQLNPDLEPLPAYILKKHYERKHGKNAYYGQKNLNS
jgi:L-ribulose-5-phosphate 4-epimerase